MRQLRLRGSLLSNLSRLPLERPLERKTSRISLLPSSKQQRILNAIKISWSPIGRKRFIIVSCCYYLSSTFTGNNNRASFRNINPTQILRSLSERLKLRRITLLNGQQMAVQSRLRNMAICERVFVFASNVSLLLPDHSKQKNNKVINYLMIGLGYRITLHFTLSSRVRRPIWAECVFLL